MSKPGRFSLFARDRHPDAAPHGTANTLQKLQKSPPPEPPPEKNKSSRLSLFGRRKSTKESPPPIPSNPKGADNRAPTVPTLVTSKPPDVTKETIAITVVDNGSRSPSTSRYEPEVGESDVSARASNEGLPSRDPSAYSGDTDMARAERDSGKDMRRTVDEDSSGRSADNLLPVDTGREMLAVDGPAAETYLKSNGSAVPQENGMASSHGSEVPGSSNTRRSWGKPPSVAFDDGNGNIVDPQTPVDGQSTRIPYSRRSSFTPSERRMSESGSRPPLPIIPPPRHGYVIELNSLQRACPGYHRQTCRSLNMHHRILCMVCRGNAPGERWVCAYCSLRFCNRCKAEFRTGKNHEQVVTRARLEGWDRTNPTAPPPGAGSRRTSVMMENGGSSRMPTGGPTERRRSMPRPPSWAPGPPQPPQQRPSQSRGAPPERLREMQRPRTAQRPTSDLTKTAEDGDVSGLAGNHARGTGFELELDIPSNNPSSRPASITGKRHSLVGKMFGS